MSGKSNIELLKELREMTNAGFAVCKSALEATQYNLSEAVKWLREQGKIQVAKVSNRDAGEGKVALYGCERCCVLVKLGCETDFTSSNVRFEATARDIAKKACGNNCVTLDDVKALCVQEIEEIVLIIKENIAIREYVRMNSSSETRVVGYVYRTHSSDVENVGKRGCLVEFKGDDRECARDVAMHIIAMNTEYLSDVPESIVQEEREILRKKMETEGKTGVILEKILDNVKTKLVKERTLVNQEFFKDSAMTVGEYVRSRKVEIVGFRVMV